MAHAAVNEPPADRLGRYEILNKLATGGMGEVYLARAVGAAGFQKHVVIKRLLPHLVEQPQFVEGLIREAKLLVMLDHPNIVQVLDLGMEGADYFMAMEYVHGYNLATVIHYCAQNNLLIPTTACVVIGTQILAGLEFAHGLRGPDGAKQNIIHRDVSPQNVMISVEGRIKLTDFGIAKVINEAEGEFTQSLKGKFRYMAPEVLEGQRLDHRYDLFAVGIILFEALCRRHLFSGNNDIEILAQVRQGQVPPLARYHPGISPALAAVVEQTLSKDPDRRFQSAGELSRALRETMAPTSESESQSELREFITTLFAKPDFPINKPKLPDLNADPLEVTRSLNLSSRLAESSRGARPFSRRRASPMVVLAALLILGASATLFTLVLLRQPPAPRSDPQVIIVSPRQDGRSPSPAPDAAAPPDARPPDAPGRRPLKVAPRPRAFTQEVGASTFRRQGARLTTCFHQHAPAGERAISLRVISTIRGSGEVAAVRLEPDTLGATPLGQCLVGVARKIRYPRHDQPVITFLQPLTLKRSE